MSQPLYQSYARVDLAFERGEGSWLYTADGDAYLDFTGGIAVNSLGHANPRLVDAVKTQAEKLWHVSNVFRIPEQERLGEMLCANTFADKVFFTNSGAEAMEAAIKTARRYQFANGSPERNRLITFEGAFHGRTLATIAAGGQEKYMEGFGPNMGGFDQVPLGDLDAVRAAITGETAGIIIEPVQGEGGIRPAEIEFLRALREICDENGLLLVLDEIQCGVGRTGKLFAYEWARIEPDIMAIAKGIGGGFPLGACLATDEAAKGMVAGTHGSTYGGNPLATAVGTAVLETVLEPGFLDEVVRKGLLLKQKIASVVDTYPDIFDLVRGQGLMLGIRCKVPAADLVAIMRGHHLLGVGAGDNVIRFLPALNVSDEEIEEAVSRLEKSAADMSAAARASA